MPHDFELKPYLNCLYWIVKAFITLYPHRCLSGLWGRCRPSAAGPRCCRSWSRGRSRGRGSWTGWTPRGRRSGWGRSPSPRAPPSPVWSPPPGPPPSTCPPTCSCRRSTGTGLSWTQTPSHLKDLGSPLRWVKFLNQVEQLPILILTIIVPLPLEDVLIGVLVVPLLALGHAQDVVDGVGGVPEEGRVPRHAPHHRPGAGTFSARSVASDLLHLLSCFVPNYPEMSTTWAQIVCYLAPLIFLFTFYFYPFFSDSRNCAENIWISGMRPMRWLLNLWRGLHSLKGAQIIKWRLLWLL